MGENRIVVRVHGELPDEPAAQRFLSAIVARLSPVGQILVSRAVRYWKVPQHFEVFVELEPPGSVSIAFQRILNELGSGWDVRRFEDGGDWAVWNAPPGKTFAFPEARWSNVECIHR